MKASLLKQWMLSGCIALAGAGSLWAQPDTTAPAQAAPDLSTNAAAAPAGAGIEVTAPVTAAMPTNESASMSVTAMPKHAPWLEHLTLGPGDVLNLSIFNAPETERDGIIVGPDGRINYLQAHDVMASGMTIDDLRTNLQASLEKYFRTPVVIAMPVAFYSKHYFLLGAVAQKGAFTMDRPLTLIEAVGRAGGLETGMYERNTVEIADLSHSFLVRNNERVPLDFEKLFDEGDLSQNVTLEPNDYVYFASGSANEVYLLGEVASPGPQAYSPTTTIIGVLTGHGGFQSKSWKSHVLVVRGSLNKPEKIIVDVAAILEGRQKDFKLQPRDIIYVARRPWARAEDILDNATMSFIQAALVTYTGRSIGPFITHPVLP